MEAVLGGATTALLWGCAIICSARANRTMGVFAALAVINAIGLAFAICLGLVWSGGLPDASARSWLLAAGAGAAAAVSFIVMFRGTTRGRVGLVGATAATDGAFAAAISLVVLGEGAGAITLIGMAAVVVGVVLSGLREEELLHATAHRDRVAIAHGLVAGCGFGLSLVLGASADIDAPWVVVCSRSAGVLLVTAPFLLRHGLPRPPRAAAPFLVLSPLLDGIGFIAFLLGSRASVAVAAVLASQSGVVSAVLGARVLGDRLGRLQWLGVAVTVGGAALLAASRA